MIGKIQSQPAFKGVYLKRDGQAVNNLKEAYNKIDAQQDNDTFLYKNNAKTSFNAILRYGLEQLNDKKLDDGETRFLTVNPIYSNDTHFPIGYRMGITDEQGEELTSSAALKEGGSVLALKDSFDDLKKNYQDYLSSVAVEKYAKICSSVDNAVAPFVVDEGPENS